MQTIEERYVDKSEYKNQDGPWMTEPDKVQWKDESTGLPCLIVRNNSGALCGYVGVSKTHPFYAKEYTWSSERELDVHGGITFSGFCQEKGGKICHVVEPGEDDKVWWLGFDCAHYGDLIPAYDPLIFEGDYRSLSYVKHEVQALASQLKTIQDKPRSSDADDKHDE